MFGQKFQSKNFFIKKSTKISIWKTSSGRTFLSNNVTVTCEKTNNTKTLLVSYLLAQHTVLHLEFFVDFERAKYYVSVHAHQETRGLLRAYFSQKFFESEAL